MEGDWAVIPRSTQVKQSHQPEWAKYHAGHRTGSCLANTPANELSDTDRRDAWWTGGVSLLRGWLVWSLAESAQEWDYAS